MDGITISGLVGSSQHDAIADDSLKDEDNAAWVMELEPCIRDEWIERISWIRLIDRLAENELVDSDSAEFRKFYAGWKWLLLWGQVKSGCAYTDVLNCIYTRWFGTSNPFDRFSIWSWNRYLKAIERYHGHNLVIDTLDQYEVMLKDLGGAFFQVLPFLSQNYWQPACYFGALDQFFNNLRDMQEDAQRGICYIPEATLAQFGVTREEIIQQTACQNPGYAKMMQFLLDHYLKRLQQKAYPLLIAEDLHSSWAILRDWSVHRYHRIERIFRDCNFDYTQFPQRYWSEVQQDLPVLIVQLRQQQQQYAHSPVKRCPHRSVLTVLSSLETIGRNVIKVASMVLSRPVFSGQQSS
ncbi:squalene/phytoene synthase family protein [Leptolyngbya sp. FACHB-321]|uniref:squalene/phytoene synthase family protein n=1 Tax=Leptolyngbya sp. FACHB-321 TaxID=2692807 RepID=UPI0016889804|nr:squalene/phytoene synthase family protein [Leptolyngbya sp. FACHB-321]MBD2037513.1 squalene/phytoene synthase family protein [Leptolyngbya sp. FACHB-321]